MKHFISQLLIAFSISLIPDSTFALTPVDEHGQLKVVGAKIINAKGEVVQLRGVSFFWSQWIGKYYNAKTVEWLVSDWKVNIVRAAMAVDHGGYATNPEEKMKIFQVVDAAIENGIYVLIDFHIHEGEKYQQQAIDFFSEVAQRYGSYPNVLYEPWNEPVDQPWSTVIKPYHEKVIAAIRKYDPDNIIVCGTRRWSQLVEEASLDPIQGDNIAYALHYYAATHKTSLREEALRAINNGVALMVTEYGTCEASGNGAIDEKETRAWWSFLDQHKISHCNWSIADKKESASALHPGTSEQGNWPAEELTESGKLVRSEIRSKN